MDTRKEIKGHLEEVKLLLVKELTKLTLWQIEEHIQSIENLLADNCICDKEI